MSIITSRGNDLYTPIRLPEITVVKELRILGIIFNDELTWNTHVHHIIQNASKRLYAIRKLRPLLTDDKLKTIYNVSVRSTLEYCSPLFVGMPQCLAQQMEQVQTRFHQILCGYESPCSTAMCLPALAPRRVDAAKRLQLRVERDEEHALRPLLQPRTLRSNRIIVPLSRTQRRKNTFLNFLIDIA